MLATAISTPNFKTVISMKLGDRFTRNLALLLERFYNVGKDSLEMKRLQSDLTMCYTIIHSFVDHNVNDFFTYNNSRVTRKNTLTIAANGKSELEANLFKNTAVHT